MSHCSLVFVPNLYVPSSPGGSAGKESACNAGDLSLIPGLEVPMEKGIATYSSILAWEIPWTVGGSKSQTGLSNFHFRSFLGVQGL